jgi:hypothetical protein
LESRGLNWGGNHPESHQDDGLWETGSIHSGNESLQNEGQLETGSIHSDDDNRVRTPDSEPVLEPPRQESPLAPELPTIPIDDIPTEEPVPEPPKPENVGDIPSNSQVEQETAEVSSDVPIPEPAADGIDSLTTLPGEAALEDRPKEAEEASANPGDEPGKPTDSHKTTHSQIIDFTSDSTWSTYYRL